MVLGLKADLSDHKREVFQEELTAFATERGCLAAECLAKTGWGVYEALGLVVQHVNPMRKLFRERRDDQDRKDEENRKGSWLRAIWARWKFDLVSADA